MIVNLGKGKIFTIKEVNGLGEVVIDVGDGSQLSSTTVNEKNQSSKTAYAICDEVLTLYDGKTVKRIRDTIFIE